MKLHALFATVALGAITSLATAPVHAQDNVCASFLCMAGKTQGKNNVQGCTAPVQAFFSPSLYIYDEEGIDWPATAANREQWLSQCQGSQGQNSGILATIIAEYGMRASG
ncbi:hypothetical protein IHE49_13675 [Rhodanobacter sp. 7MK24]|uniref:hypothetical protein n=1 Tax=Rhodanobacter sp. 7MK24 TaxID=2775922 RepID=UPI001781CDF2|nr:hypothetical protein [Rhodanobacter sp. 7MK24]MBD8881532.1 hypothetical protein [Rhodanobacter sp. 7MK24]